MRKLFFECFILLFIFAGIWFSLSRIKWTTLLHIDEKTDAIEEKLGDFYWEYFSSSEEVIDDPVVVNAIGSIMIHLCESNDIEPKKFKVYILNNPMVNAFALPDKRIVLYSGLIQDVSGEEELAGVICHEMAHIELNHVMKGLIKEFGLSVLTTMISGSGGEVLSESVRLLSSSAYDRKMEKEADLKAIEYMIAAQLPPEGLPNFLFNLAQEEPEYYRYMTWANTHPETNERVDYLLAQIERRSPSYAPIQILTTEEWDIMQNTLLHCSLGSEE